MKKYITKVLCRGCQAELPVSFQAEKVFCSVDVPTQCPGCESYLLVQIEQHAMRKNLYVRVRMIKHTEKLLKILEERRLYAKDHAEA